MDRLSSYNPRKLHRSPQGRILQEAAQCIPIELHRMNQYQRFYTAQYQAEMSSRPQHMLAEVQGTIVVL